MPAECAHGPLGEAEHVDSSHHTRLHSLDGVVLVVNGRCGAGQVIDLVHFEKYWLRYIVSNELEVVIVEQAENVFSTPRIEIIQAENIVPAVQQTFAQMRADKARATSYQDAHEYVFSIG